MVWTVGSLALLATALGSRCAAHLDLTMRQERQLQARYIALAGVQGCLQVLDSDSTPTYDGLAEPWARSETYFSNRPMGAGQFTVQATREDPLTGNAVSSHGLADEERKIPLNTAPPDILNALLAHAGGLREQDREEIVDSILDWRDEDHEKGPYGAESFYYLGLDPAYECKDGPFENIEELLLIRGMTPELFSRLAPHVTVHGSGQVNLNTAGPTVLRTLGLSEPGVQGVVTYCSGEDSQPGTADDRALTAASAAGSELANYVPAEDLNRLAQLDAEGVLGVRSTEFEFEVTAQVAEDEVNVTRLRVTMDRKGRIRAWEER